MHTLYDSESFSVTHMLANAPQDGDDATREQAAHTKPAIPSMPRHGFEIIDKRVGREVYLDGCWAELFQQQIAAWQVVTPTQEEIEDALEGYAGLGQNPVVLH